MTLYDWPRAAAFGRVVPKGRIYDHAGANSQLRELFVREVEQISWSHKLAPETINLPASRQVTEIQIFRIRARTPVLDRQILRAIDRAIPFPLIFEVTHGGRTRMVAAYKRPSGSDSAKWVTGDYFTGAWQADDAPRATMPLALNMGALYEQLLAPLVEGETAQLLSATAEAPQAPRTATADEAPVSLEMRLARAEAIKAQTRVVERLAARLARERQFNKRVDINAELRAARQELERLTTSKDQRGRQE